MSTPLLPGASPTPPRPVWPDDLTVETVEAVETLALVTTEPDVPEASATTKRPWWRRARVLAPAAFLVGVAVGAAGSGGGEAVATIAAEPAGMVTATPGTLGNTAAPSTAVGPGASAAPASKAARRTASFAGDGTYLVPDDVTPGTYRSEKTDSGNCYWARLKDPAGGLGAIIANYDNNLGPSVVTITPTDKAFETAGCATWTRVD